ncbi:MULTISPECIES: alpha/beta hydrolase [Streptomyces]|uniref:Alpha/beta hydrolase n=1 Tax=Streptomyces caniscabiei TaxID=2746961 RepID=A0ABU4MRB8_9ACTN|nr:MULTISPECIES: alpha/beta hydrolase [Streptomyces]MBE4734382.1 alpha/beta fold hydrolase [Streptomyces caniscabiei]MBE4755253.1 alpha/beta fold hydrolase [Streptomyces caniscabiei]MBE4771333.1 alpha/beta fold hydrolase [Streptomyces caniscabiei]MBE4783462.1 alpha/beta fold hydrolase [Streptomyces caniscabiei]MBE4792766.1 alpha/beta fold hydrolase [Streptomyces caniscabiei]
MRAAVLHGTVGAVVLSCLGAAPPAERDLSRTAAESVAVAAARAADEGIRFGPCPVAEGLPDEVRCGTFEVPLDYARPGGRQISLTVSRIEARRKDAQGRKVARQGALVFNPGGPGASGMFFPLVGHLPEWKRLGAAYDLVGYAPRGVGRSAPLSCQDPARLHRGPAPAPTHPSESYKKERVARAKAYARDCARRGGSALRHYHSLNNARDLDVLRAALGEPRLTFLGASYGTYLGALYAALFPSHVRRMVFDSVVNPAPEQIWYRNNLDQSAAFEGRWADFRAWVARHHRVYGLGDTPYKVLRSYERAAARLADRPAAGTVGPAQLQGAFLQAAYYDDLWPQRALALAAYLKGDPKPLVQIAGPYPEAAVEQENAKAVYTAVECNDAPWPTRWSDWDRDNTRLARTAPFETWDNVWTNLPCAYWSGPRQRPLDVRTGPGELPPTLILAAERDAAAPYDGAIELHRRLWGAALVTERDAGNHGVAGGTNRCVNGYLEAYLLEGRVPDRRAACAGRPEPSAARPKAVGKPRAVGELRAAGG